MKIEAESLSRLPGLRHGFFTRQGGVSAGLYGSLNCGLGSKDDQGHVAENRRRVAGAMGLEAARLASPYQTHSTDALAVGGDWRQDRALRGDALATREPGIAIAITTADCVPVLLADPEAGVIGAAHAGWRGALDGILEATLEAMAALGARPAATLAAVGPAIAQASYEVGPEFPAPFLAQDPASEAFFRPAERAGHFRFDIKGYVARRLERSGIEQLEVLDGDTCAEPARFFSYRRACLRGETDYGRSLSAICLEP